MSSGEGGERQWWVDYVMGLPTFQRCGDAAHLIETCIALTADHLGKEQEGGWEGARLGLTPPCGREGSLGALPEEQKILEKGRK